MRQNVSVYLHPDSDSRTKRLSGNPNHSSPGSTAAAPEKLEGRRHPYPLSKRRLSGTQRLLLSQVKDQRGATGSTDAEEHGSFFVVLLRGHEGSAMFRLTA